MNLGEFLYCTTFFLAPMMSLAILMMQRLLQDFMTKVADRLNARRRLIFSTQFSLASHDDSKEMHTNTRGLAYLMLGSLVEYISFMVHSFGIVNALKAIVFSRDGPMCGKVRLRVNPVSTHDYYSNRHSP